MYIKISELESPSCLYTFWLDTNALFHTACCGDHPLQAAYPPGKPAMAYIKGMSSCASPGRFQRLEYVIPLG